MKKKLQKVIGVLSIMKDFNMKPNFSELERMYGIDRHTIKMVAYLSGRSLKEYLNGILYSM